MSDSNRKREFLGDLSKLMTRHGGWMTKQAAQQLAHIRAKGMAEFERGFPVVAHTSLDERLVRLPVQLGVAESVERRNMLVLKDVACTRKTAVFFFVRLLPPSF